MISHSLPTLVDLDAKLIETDFHMQELLSLENNEMNEYSEFVEEDLKEYERTMHTNSAKEIFRLKIIQRHRSILTKVLTYSTAILDITIATMIVIASIRTFMNLLITFMNYLL